MDRLSYIRNLAFLYFEGKIPRDAESVLFDFINENSRHFTLFRKWEREWLNSGQTNADVERQWKRLHTRMLANEAAMLMFPKHRFTFRRMFSFVAVVLVLVCLSVAILYRNVHTGMEVSYFVNETPLGDKTRLLLADGSSVWLNSGSTLKYSTGFNAKNRVVVLDGEGYFEVKQNGGVPFTVHTHGYDVVVKGTKFNVSAYEEDPFISTTLIEGKVTVNYKDESVDMQPGEEMKLIKSTGELQHSRVNAAQSNAWTNNQLVDDNITFQELMMRLSRRFDVRIYVDDEVLSHQTFSVSLRNEETLEQVFDALQKIIPFSVKKENQSYHITSINH